MEIQKSSNNIYRSPEGLFRYCYAHIKYVANQGSFDLDILFLNIFILFCLGSLLWEELPDGLSDMGCSSSSEQGLFYHMPSPAALKIERRGFLFLNMKHIEVMVCEFWYLISRLTNTWILLLGFKSVLVFLYNYAVMCICNGLWVFSSLFLYL